MGVVKCRRLRAGRQSGGPSALAAGCEVLSVFKILAESCPCRVLGNRNSVKDSSAESVDAESVEENSPTQNVVNDKDF